MTTAARAGMPDRVESAAGSGRVGAVCWLEQGRPSEERSRACSGSPGAGAGGCAPGTGGGAPSHALPVTFASGGSEAVKLTIAELKSRLGNFLPQPDTCDLASGPTGALYSMSGSLPVDVVELELTVTVRTQDGRSDMRVVMPKAGTAPDAVGGA